MKKDLSVKSKAIFVLLISIILLSIAPLIIRWVPAPGVVTSFYRMFIAACFISVITLFQRNFANKTKTSWKLWILPVLAGMSSGVDHSLWSTAVGNTFVAKANLLNHIAPLWVGLIAVFILREKYAKRFWLGLVIVLSGAWAISGANIEDFSTLKFNGEGFAVFSSFFYAGYIILSEQSRKFYGSLRFVQISSFAASCVLGIIILLNGWSLIGYSGRTYLLFLTVGLLSQVGGYYCLAYSLGKIPASIVSPFLLLHPVVTAALASVIFQENLQISQIIGGVLVLVGIYIITLSKPKEKLIQTNDTSSWPIIP